MHKKYMKQLMNSFWSLTKTDFWMSGYDVSAQQEKIGSHVFSGQCGKRKASITAKTLQANMLDF